MSHNEIICFCSGVTKQEIVAAIENGAMSLQNIRDMTGACTIGRCKELSPRKQCCSSEIMKILKENG